MEAYFAQRLVSCLGQFTSFYITLRQLMSTWGQFAFFYIDPSPFTSSPSTWYHVLGTKFLVLSTRYQISPSTCTKYLVPSTWYQAPGGWYLADLSEIDANRFLLVESLSNISFHELPYNFICILLLVLMHQGRGGEGCSLNTSDWTLCW